MLVAELKGFVLHKLTALSHYLTEIYTCISIFFFLLWRTPIYVGVFLAAECLEFFTEKHAMFMLHNLTSSEAVQAEHI